MKNVVLFRHGTQVTKPNAGAWQPLAPLSRGGRELIRKVAAKLNGSVRFQLCVSSPLVRAVETAGILVERGLVASGEIEVDPDLGPLEMHAWEHFFASYTGTPTAAGVYEAVPQLFAGEGLHVYQAVQRLAKRLVDDETAVAVSHQPLIEAAAAVAELGPPRFELQKGDAIVFMFNASNMFRKCYHWVA
jgi:broad specificity phosphatase PhoE